MNQATYLWNPPPTYSLPVRGKLARATLVTFGVGTCPVVAADW